MDEAEIRLLTASRCSRALQAGALTAERLARTLLARIAERDPDVKAWSFVDPDQVLRDARELDKCPRLGPLHGLPVGVKDTIDVRDVPTRHNSPIYEGHRPSADAACVAALRAQGALILGKTDTTEFAAAGRMAATRNPHDLDRTPGGSSSGSAAAVADGQVPLALGTQTGGSTIRPASFCGIPGFKPTWGAVSAEGLKLYAVSFDTLGWFGREVADLWLLADAFGLRDDAEPARRPVRSSRVALCRSPVWTEAEPGLDAVVDAAAERLRRAGAEVVDVDLPDGFEQLDDMHRVILHSEGRAAFRNMSLSHPHELHDDFKAQVENRSGITRRDLLAAYDHAARCRSVFDAMASEYDAVLTPSAPGEAPMGDRPGHPAFNRMWTLLHVPCVNLPGFMGPNRLPVGVTLVGPRFRDCRLLAFAQEIESVFATGLA